MGCVGGGRNGGGRIYEYIDDEGVEIVVGGGGFDDGLLFNLVEG